MWNSPRFHWWPKTFYCIYKWFVWSIKYFAICLICGWHKFSLFRTQFKGHDLHSRTRINKWFKENKLSVNLNKTKYMVFTNHHKHLNVQLSLDGVNIERVSELRFLGVTIDERLNWKSHVANTQKKVCKNLSILHIVKYFVNGAALMTLYCTLILPY